MTDERHNSASELSAIMNALAESAGAAAAADLLDPRVAAPHAPHLGDELQELEHGHVAPEAQAEPEAAAMPCTSRFKTIASPST